MICYEKTLSEREIQTIKAKYYENQWTENS